MSDQVAGSPSASANVDIAKEVSEALSLLEYAVSNGVKTTDGNPIPQDIVNTIKAIAVKLGLTGSAPGGPIDAGEWALFEMAYYNLASALAPVTAETLRNTQTKPYRERTWCEHIIGSSPALAFTRLLLCITLLFAGFVICSAWYQGYKAEDTGDLKSYAVWRIFFELMTPWVYGGLGACVYLLRSAHTYIYQRSFDVRRKPEYTNRVLLGAVAGGAIMLFASQVSDDDGNVVKLSSAALGFLAGYNTDFLFSAIERVSQAILPKIGLDSVQQGGGSGGTQPININDLAARMDAAKTPADKQFYQSMLTRLTGTPAPQP
jgi:hypothetical protein